MESTVKNTCNGSRGCRVYRLPYDRKVKSIDYIKKNAIKKPSSKL